IVDREILVAAVDKAAPRAGEGIEFARSKAHRLDREPALDPLLDRRAARPAIGVYAHPLARGAADQIVDRQSGALAENVPGCDLDRTPRRQEFRRAALDREILVHDLAGVANAEYTAADYVWRHRLDAFGDDLLLALGDVGLAPAIEAVLSLDAAEQQILRAASPEDEGFDPSDLHALSSRCEERILDCRLSGVEPG